MAYDPGKNPFFTEEDDDYSFRGSRNERGLPGAGGGRAADPFGPSDEQFGGHAHGQMANLERIQQMKENSMNNQLDSTQRALASLYESERMGVATAEELLEQGEKLDNVEQKLDTVNQDMKTTQKHLNNIKSVFGGIKNWWSGGSKDTQPVKTSQPVEDEHRRLENTLQAQRATAPHPGMRVRGDVAGFYENDDDDLDGQFLASGPKGRSQAHGYQADVATPSFKGQLASSGNVKADTQLEDNLDLMSDGMSRLKGLAIGLGDEITTQNEQVDRITGKAERADTKIRDQNRQMKKILGK